LVIRVKTARDDRFWVLLLYSMTGGKEGKF